MVTATFPPPIADGVLVATSSAQVRERVLSTLQRRASVHMAYGGAEALAKLENGHWQLLFLDRQLPDLDSEELVNIIERRYPGIRVVMVDSKSAEPASTAWPARSALNAEKTCLSVPTVHTVEPLPGMIGSAPEMLDVYRMTRLVASRETTVLITGPTGSGKELVAHAIHQLSRRASGTFSVLNCAAIPEALVESELFGYARGAFTGALQTYCGRILAAQGGTLFLDEIGELPLSAQSKLLRFLEQKEVQRLGSIEVNRVDVRVVAATNRDLGKLVEAHQFRDDLFYRLSAFPIELPRLAERRCDIPELVSHFLRRFNEGKAVRLDTAAEDMLREYAWPGNVRELQQVLERAVILATNRGVILPQDLRLCTAPKGLRLPQALPTKVN